ncbi:aminotransferase class IV [Streptomyces sp. NPDC047108]|uniref:aminotransferase class IV n=1 Tax=Streptomyces sp. NPDC047108 TaxID=3155025 RepID=UPI0033C54775
MLLCSARAASRSCRAGGIRRRTAPGLPRPARRATGANLFLLIDDELHTPVPDCFLNGITRQTVIGLARDLGITVRERHLEPTELDSAQEVFLTGTAYEVQPVRAIDDRTYPVGKVTRSLAEAYTHLVRAPK